MAKENMKLDFLVHDTNAAAFLITQRHQLAGLEPVGRNRYSFKFQDDGTVEKDQAAFYAGATCPAREFADALRQVKNLLYGVRNSGIEKDVMRDDPHQRTTRPTHTR